MPFNSHSIVIHGHSIVKLLYCFTVHCLLFYVIKLFIIKLFQCISVFIVHCFIVHCLLFTVFLYFILCTLYFILCTLYFILCTLYFVLNTFFHCPMFIVNTICQYQELLNLMNHLLQLNRLFYFPKQFYL